jgi:hypothetical protein
LLAVDDSVSSGIEKDMGAMNFLKRYFPNSPNWLLGGLLTVLVLWLIVLPAEIIEISIRQEYVPFSLLGWSIKFLYMWGYAISLFTIAPLVEYSSAPDQLAGTLVVLFGLTITSPAYFLIGAFVSGRKESMMALGVVLAILHLVVSCSVSIWLLKFFFGA